MGTYDDVYAGLHGAADLPAALGAGDFAEGDRVVLDAYAQGLLGPVRARRQALVMAAWSRGAPSAR